MSHGQASPLRKVASSSILKEADDEVLAALNRCSLREDDEVVLLDDASVSPESYTLKNVALRLAGDTPYFPSIAFSANWNHGISAVQLPHDRVQAVLGDASRRAALLRKLQEAIPNEVSDASVVVGPSLFADDEGRDCTQWTAGLDSRNSCIGLYCCEEERHADGAPPEAARAHLNYYLIVKAGGGRAAQEFAGLMEAHGRDGTTLNGIFSEQAVHSEMHGDQLLRRVAQAGRRNRARLLVLAARALGLEDCLDTTIDHAASLKDPQSKLAILTLDCQSNILVPRRFGNQADYVYYAGCVPSDKCQGLLLSNTANTGFIKINTNMHQNNTALSTNNYYSSNDALNAAWNAIPFGTRRVCTNNEALRRAVSRTHVDDAWIRQHFAWPSHARHTSERRPDDGVVNAVPCCLWGTNKPQTWTQTETPQLGLLGCSVSRLRPLMVALAGVEADKLITLTRARSARP